LVRALLTHADVGFMRTIVQFELLADKPGNDLDLVS
jgi:hypothetical protein